MRRKNRYTERRKGIVTPYGQWKYPGMVTKIPSNDITMKGVPYPVLGVSDKGDIKMMFPEEEYKFDGKEVTEYPIGKYATGTELHNPLKNMTITSRFSNLYPRVFKGGENRKSPHYGIDLRADIGTDLYSTGDGIVKKIVENPTGSAGRYIVIESPDHTLHTYMHLDSVSKNLKLGQNVKAGEIIGKTGNSGSKDPHLHYQVQLLSEGTTFDDFDGINDKRIINRVINPALYDWSQYNGHGLPSIQNNEVYPLSYNIGPSYPIAINPINTTYYEKNDNIELSNEQSANIMNQKYTYKTPTKLMFPPLFKQQNGGMKKYLEGNYVDFPMSKNRWKPQEEYNDSSWTNFLGAGIGAIVPISIALWNKYGNQSNNKSNTLPSDMRDDYSYQMTHHYPIDNSINTDVQQQINDDAENKLKISQNMNFTGPISVTPWNYTMKPFKINYDFPFKLQFGKYLSGNYVNNVISQWNNKLAESISKGDSIANMVGTGINAAASIAVNVLNQWGANNSKQDWMTKQQRGDNTGTMAEIERGEVISTPNGMSIANPIANYHELYTNQNENNGTRVQLSNDVNSDVEKNPALSRRSNRVNKYTAMRRNGRSFIFPSTVGMSGLLEPKNGVEYPMAEVINGSKMQTGGVEPEKKYLLFKNKYAPGNIKVKYDLGSLQGVSYYINPQQQLDYYANWLDNRRKVLEQNMKDTGTYPQTNKSISNLLSGYEPGRIEINQEIYKQLNNAKQPFYKYDFTDYYLDSNSNGNAFIDDDVFIRKGLNKNDEWSTILHELTHRANYPDVINQLDENGNYYGYLTDNPERSPQELKIKNMNIRLNPLDITDDEWKELEEIAPNIRNMVELENKYYLNPTEIYARMMQFRHENNLDPYHIYTKEEIEPLLQKSNVSGIDMYNVDDFVRLLNEVADNSKTEEDNNLVYNSPLNQKEYNAMFDKFLKGGPIHIKPSKRGTFTTAATKHGMGVQEFARKVLANKDNYSSAMVKKANFARNSSHWKHQDGGNVDLDLLWKNNQSIGNNRKMNKDNMRQIDDYLISKNMPLAQRQALLYTILQESGANTLGAHGNGYYGLVGWSSDRYNSIKDKSLIGQAEYLYDTLYNGNGTTDWNHGGKGSGYNSWSDAQKAFKNANDFDTAIRALTYGYIRPAEDVRNYRLKNGVQHFIKQLTGGIL